MEVLKVIVNFFSKNVKVSMMFKSNEWRNFSGALVEFEASARSAWHTHPQGQTLIVTEGEIITKVPGQKAFIAKKRRCDKLSYRSKAFSWCN